MKTGFIKTGNVDQSNTGYLKLAGGTTAQRPSYPANGMVRFNTDLGYIEQYNNSTWAALSSSVSTFPGYKQNVYYGTPANDDQTITSQWVNTGTIYACPFYIPNNGNFNRIGVNVGQAGYQSTLRFGIYNNVDGDPTSLLYDLGTVNTTTTGEKEVVFSHASALYNTWVWVAINLDAGTGIYSFGYTNNGSIILGRSTSTSYASAIGISATGSGNTLPSTFPTASLVTGFMPYIWLRRV